MNHPDQEPDQIYWTDGDPTTPVFQRPEEAERLFALYTERAPRRVLEVGVYHGGTLKQWLQRGKPERVVAVDLFLPRYDCRVKAEGWAREANVELFTVQGDSRATGTVAAATSLGPYDWIYIDADHSYQAVAADWRNYAPLIAPGGVVLFHDIVACPVRHPEMGVPQLWAELKAAYRTTEIVEDYTAKWAGIGIVFL